MPHAKKKSGALNIGNRSLEAGPEGVEKSTTTLDFEPVYATRFSALDALPVWWYALAAVFSVIFFFMYTYNLEAKIQHHDEGVNILIMEDMFTSYPYKYKYDPENYHGPSLYFFTYWYSLINIWWQGIAWEHAYDHGLTVFVSRCVTVTGGLALLVTLLVGLRNRTGNAGALLAFIICGLCTDVIWIARYYIHEIFVTLFVAQMYIFATWYTDTKNPKYLYWTAFAFAMHMTIKEISIIHATIMILADICAQYAQHMLNAKTTMDMLYTFPLLQPFRGYLRGYRELTFRVKLNTFLSWFTPFAFFFSVAGCNPYGMVDAFRTYYFWADQAKGTGHAKHYLFWITDMIMPYDMTLWVMALPSFALALASNHYTGLYLSFLSTGFILCYSIITYKTAWCVPTLCLTLILLAAWGFNVLVERILASPLVRNKKLSVFAVCAIVAGLQVIDLHECYDLVYVNWDDDRHPQCYVHCDRDMFKMVDHINAAAQDSGLGFKFPLSMVTDTQLHPLYTFIREYEHVTWPDIAIVRRDGPDKNNVVGASLIMVNERNAHLVEGWIDVSKYSRDVFKFEPGSPIVVFTNLRKTRRDGLGSLKLSAKTDVNKADLRSGLKRKAWDDLEWGAAGGAVREDTEGVVGMNFWWDHMEDRTWVGSPVSVTWTGYIDAPTSGNYEFSTNSDDGSYVYLDGYTVVDNGGTHGAIQVTETVWLDAGLHEFQYQYMDYVGSMVNEFKWTPPGAQEPAPIPDEQFFYRP